MDKLIIACAITGSRISREQCPDIPVTPEEIIESAVGAAEAGAAIVHIHVRDLQSGIGTQDVELFRRVADGIRARSDVVQCLTTSGIPGVNLPDDVRLAPLALTPEMGSVDCGSLNFGDQIFLCSETFIARALTEMQAMGIKPEMCVFELGMIECCKRMIDRGLVEKPYYFGFIMGTPSGAPASMRSLLTFVESLPPDSTWFVAGIGRHQLPITTAGILLGGHVRVGMEDNLQYLAGVPARTNAELVARCVRIARELGRDLATPDEARTMLRVAVQGG